MLEEGQEAIKYFTHQRNERLRAAIQQARTYIFDKVGKHHSWLGEGKGEILKHFKKSNYSFLSELGTKAPSHYPSRKITASAVSLSVWQLMHKNARWSLPLHLLNCGYQDQPAPREYRNNTFHLTTVSAPENNTGSFWQHGFSAGRSLGEVERTYGVCIQKDLSSILLLLWGNFAFSFYKLKTVLKKSILLKKKNPLFSMERGESVQKSHPIRNIQFRVYGSKK